MNNLLPNGQRPTGSIPLLTLAVICMCLLVGCGTEVGGNRKPTHTPKGVGVPTSPPSSLPSSAEPTLGPYQFTDGNGMPFPVPSTEANPISVTTKEDAWGSRLDIKEIPSLVDKDHIFLLRAVAADGKVIAGWIVPRSENGQEATRLALMDVATRQITEVAVLPTTGQDINQFRYSSWGKIYMDGGWVVWQEGPQLKIYNISTQKHRQIATASDNMGAIPGFYRMARADVVSLDHDLVVWAEGSNETPEAGKLASVIKSLDLATGTISVIGKHGANPVISWPNVAWLEPNLVEDTEGLIYSKPVVVNLTTGEKQYMSERYHVGAIALYGDTLLVNEWGMMFLNNLAETRRQIITPQQNRSNTYGFTLTDRLVAWCSRGPQVWDRTLQSLVSLGGASDEYGATLVNESALAWQASPNYSAWMESRERGELPADFNIYLIDTSHLPK
jgi:hypothetical protein